MFSFLPSLDEEKKSLQVPFISSRPLNRIEEIAFGPKKIQSTYRRQVQGRCTLQQACKVGLCLFKTTSQVVKIAPFGQGVFSKCAMFAQKTFALLKMSFILSYLQWCHFNVRQSGYNQSWQQCHSILLASERNISQPVRNKAKKSAKQLRSDTINARASIYCYSFRETKEVVEEQDNKLQWSVFNYGGPQ